MFRHTKIGATIGPACESEEKLVALVQAGMNFARLNFSHGTHNAHQEYINRIRAVEKKTGQFIGIMQDLTGPRIRLGKLPEGGVKLSLGETAVFAIGVELFEDNKIPIYFSGLAGQLSAGERILIDDGRIEVVINTVDGNTINTEVNQGGVAVSNKGLNFPDTVLNIPAIQEKDRLDLEFGVAAGVDMIAMSFVKDADDVKALRALIQTYAKTEAAKTIQIFAKIERHEAVRNITEILEAADGIMVARGDLGLELLEAEVPLIQKKIVDAANAAGKPVIVATQLLDSMQHSRRPSRAEVSDVANAVIDHADALLLTNETAAGEFPVETVKSMAEIILLTEASSYDDMPLPTIHAKGTSVEVAITELSRILAEETSAKYILAGSLTGETGRMISRVRPPIPVLVATLGAQTARQLNVSWGILPFLMLPCKTIEEFVEGSTKYIKKNALAEPGDKIIIVAGEPVGQAGKINLVEIREIK